MRMLLLLCLSLFFFLSDVKSTDVQSTAKPLQCGLNEIAVKRRTVCPPQNCEIPYTEYNCEPFKNIFEPGCDCLPNYLRNGSGICIENDKCPYPTSPICGINEIARDCRRICPPQTCEGRFALFKCRSDIPCEPGCDCLPNYLRNSEGVCVHVDKCDTNLPKCGKNEIATNCRKICPPQTCKDKHRFALIKCRSDIPCEPGCDCLPNYLRNSEGVCIPENKCDASPACSVSHKCRRTCAFPNPPNCPYEPSQTNNDGCECMEGFILSKVGGTCIRIEHCPTNCNGDSHARAKQCPLPCPSTCESPNASPCKKMCEPIGCECEPGYIFSKHGDKCVLPDDCPGGNPCPVNSEFQQCTYNCPQNYCPVDENSDRIVCDPPRTCLSGCACKLNHRKLSYEDDRCVVASDCPPVSCTRPNEVWNGCPSECFSGYCADREYQDVTCNTLLLNCQPKCVCKRDTFRNDLNICVPASECPPLCLVPDECRRTCAFPNPPNCSYKPSHTNKDGCECMEGYILSEIGGKCIKIEDCPSEGSCNGDPNARPRQCPAPCPSTCKSPEQIPCRVRCEPIGCECKPGYIRSTRTGLCILPNRCQGGNPCGPNSNFVPCKYGCPTNYCPVDDSRGIVICEPSPVCLSGCACHLNHKWLSREDKRCIASYDCPPVNCTRPNEVWSSCPSACLAESCQDVDNQPSTCNTLVYLCEPKCICMEGFFRNDLDICIPKCDC